MDYHVEESDLKDGKCIYEFGGKWLPIIWIDSTKSKKEQLGILVHEITHAIYWMMSDREIAHNLDTDEVYAYIHQYFFNEAYENL